MLVLDFFLWLKDKFKVEDLNFLWKKCQYTLFNICIRITLTSNPKYISI